MGTNFHVFDPRAFRIIRTQQGLTLTEVAELCGVSKGQPDLWESGRMVPTHDQAMRLAQALKARGTQLYRWAELDSRASRELLLATIEELRHFVQGAVFDQRRGAGRTRAQHFSAQRFRQARELVPFTQEKLAREMGVNRGTLIRWEQGQTTPDSALVLKAAHLLQKPLSWFYVQAAVQTTRAARVELGSLVHECCLQNLSYEALAERAELDPDRAREILEQDQTGDSWELSAMRKALGLAEPDVETTMNDPEVREELSLLSAAIEELVHSVDPVESAAHGGASVTKEGE